MSILYMSIMSIKLYFAHISIFCISGISVYVYYKNLNLPRLRVQKI